MQKKGSLDRIRAKYPGYYQKKSPNWKKEKEVRDLAIKEKVCQISTQTINENIVAYSNTIDSMNKNINKLFKLL
tara:strand:- start:1708 stop:1929 length:222 start_codon:yes stop_codon:yes gene_type:complete